jgi:hypothetical protein
MKMGLFTNSSRLAEKQIQGLLILNLRMRERSVEGLTLRIIAAPLGPSIRQFVFSNTRTI